MTRIQFTKLSATGNDFILINNSGLGLGADDAKLFQKICQRRTGVGADGVLLLDDHAEHAFSLRYFNADGSQAGCGNGARAAAYYACFNGLAAAKMTFEFNSDIFSAAVDGTEVKVRFPEPRNLRTGLKIFSGADFEEAGFVDTGVPHFVLFGGNVAAAPVLDLGREYRYHAAFQPDGTNVDFVQVESENLISVRTYERGVEDETLSCGTGVVASALFATLSNRAAWPVRIQARGGDLVVSREGDGALHLAGRVDLIYAGVLDRPL